MKKIILAFLVLFFACGCTNVATMNLEEIINTGINRKISMYNEYRVGYKYYLPKGIRNIDYTDYNEKLTDSKYIYHLYIDAVSYVNKVLEKYEENPDCYYSQAINNKDKFGYIEIKNIEEDKYLIEIMYNYAKIEVIVREVDINFTVLNSLNILSSITYNDKILDNLMGENVLQYKETEFNIFEPKDDSNYLYYKEKDEEQNNEEVHDSDLIN